jgi:protoheme IX farnesyltransferase
MLPATHGKKFASLYVLLYSFVLFAATLLPFAIRMSGVPYLAAAVVLSGQFVRYAWRLYRNYSDALARKLFHYSILYLALIFGALLLDHWVTLI